MQQEDERTAWLTTTSTTTVNMLATAGLAVSVCLLAGLSSVSGGESSPGKSANTSGRTAMMGSLDLPSLAGLRPDIDTDYSASR